MTHQAQLADFRKYLHSLPDDLLTSLTRCYVWLAGLRDTGGKQRTGLNHRRDCCLAECARRRAIRQARAGGLEVLPSTDAIDSLHHGVRFSVCWPQPPDDSSEFHFMYDPACSRLASPPGRLCRRSG